MSEEKTARQIMEEVCNDVCDHYCMFPVIYKPTYLETVDDDYMQRMFQERCRHCPLKRLI